VSLFAYIALVYAFLADLILYQAKFNGMEVAGAALITFFNIFTIVWQHKHPEIDEKKSEPLENEQEELKPMLSPPKGEMGYNSDD
jgi:hypothetical protein